jgi:hypothetical protein
MDKVRWEKFIEDTRKFYTEPVDFFNNMEKQGGFLEPIVYISIMGALAGIIYIIWSLFSRLMPLAFPVSLSFLIILPLNSVISAVIVAALLHLLWLIMGSKEEFETSFRCVAAISALIPLGAVLGALPIAGNIIYIWIAAFYLVMASNKVHQIPLTKARNVFIVIAAFLTFVFLTGGIKMEKYKKQMEKQQEVIQENYPRQKEY